MDIKKILTKEEKEFIKHHGISLSEIYDARGKVTSVYHKEAKTLGCLYVINSCMYGHRLKTRSGHCIQCRPANIAFQKRYSEQTRLLLIMWDDIERNLAKKNICLHASKMPCPKTLRKWNISSSWRIEDS